MTEFKKQIEEYSFPDSKELTEDYLNKYWLPEQEFLTKWKAIQSTIFNLNNAFPKMIINESKYRLLARLGGLLFEQDEFKLLKDCFDKTNDKNIVIIESFNESNPPHESGPLLRLKYPAQITWDKIDIGDGISYELFHRPVRNYFVFGDSGKWGKYTLNDYEIPIEIYCFKQEYETIFRNRFKATKEEQQELKGLLPIGYLM